MFFFSKIAHFLNVGGRILTSKVDNTEKISQIRDLAKNVKNIRNKSLQKSLAKDLVVAPTYTFEQGAGWIHGFHGNSLSELFADLFNRYNPAALENKATFEDEAFRVFEGNAWMLPEFMTFETFSMYDGKTLRPFTFFDYNVYICIVCIHLRGLMRQFNGVSLAKFAPKYIVWLVEQLRHVATSEQWQNNAPAEFQLQPEVFARAVSWYFHSVEGYLGIPIGLMSASDLVASQQTGLPFESDIDYEIFTDILNTDAYTSLESTILRALQFTQDKQDAAHVLLEDYLASPFVKADASLQGSSVGPHCTMHCGLSSLFLLMKQHIEHVSQKPLNIELSTCVTRLSCLSPPDNNQSAIAPEEQSDINTCIINGKISLTTSPVLSTAALSLSASSDQNDCSKIAATTTDNAPIATLYTARYGVVCAASVKSCMRTIEFPSNATPNDTAVTQARQDLFDTSSPVFYKKVLFCFPYPWWTKKQTRLFALTQNFLPGQNPEAPGDSMATPSTDICDIPAQDMSEAGYRVVIEGAQQRVATQSPDLVQTVAEIVESGRAYDAEAAAANPELLTASPTLNMMWESHIANKETAVLSCSLVGNFGYQMAELHDDRVVYNIVWRQLEKLYAAASDEAQELGDDKSALLYPGNLPAPLWCRTTHWAEHPFILQSYSLITDCRFSTSQRVGMCKEYGVVFAGEHCHVQHGGSVHGALDSGINAVDALIDSYPVSN